jgi:hypothetical protein
MGRTGPFRKKPKDDSKFMGSNGYVMVRTPTRTKPTGEHILKAEAVLGRRIRRGECIHHIDGDPSNNANNNLLVCSRGYHAQLHARMSYLYQREKFGGA